MSERLGIKSIHKELSVEISEDELLSEIESLNADDSVHGILVQLPLPAHIDTEKVLNAIDYQKDVDGFHTLNAGALSKGLESTIPCTPLGSIILLKRYLGDLSGKNAVVIGRSNIVGKPVGQLLLKNNCTVTYAHSRTKDLPAVCRQADIIIAAIGKPEFVGSDFVKEGAVIIDVGINAVQKEDSDGNSKRRLVGDVDFNAVCDKCSAITPVPGGVGPMTIACLMYNCLYCASMIHNVDFEMSDDLRA
jgi:methylenetetrahydrofolate dehydrogenase (NADP+)/methenyltetrahydrofolate cyclohydrolase